MKKLTLFATLFFLFQFAFSQSDTTVDYFNPNNLQNTNKGLNGYWGMNVGAFAGSYNQNAYFGSFLSPNYSVDLTQKLSIQAGFTFTTFNTSGFSNSEGVSTLPKTLYNSFFYTQGTYKLSEKVFLTGGAYTSLIKPTPSNALNPAAFNDIAKGGKIGIGYNINEKSSIYFEMQFNKGNSPFNSYSSPFRNQTFGSPLTGW